MQDFQEDRPEPDEDARSPRTRAALAIAWLALQLLRLMFLPFLLPGLIFGQKRRRSKHPPTVKPLPTASREI